MSKHAFFSGTVNLRDYRYAYFDIVAKSAAIEVEGIDVGLRYDELKAVFESQSNFSSRSQVAKRLKDALTFLELSLSHVSTMLRNRSIVQSLIALAARIVEGGQAAGHEQRFGEFVSGFLGGLSKQVELGHDTSDPDFVSFQKTVNANVRSGARTRQSVLLRKLLQFDPSFADLLQPATLAASDLEREVNRLAKDIGRLITSLNEAYAGKHGKDLIKATNKTSSAIASIGKPARDLGEYGDLITSLYFLFWEGPGTRLDGRKPQSFVDIGELRTALQHDVDHGRQGKIKAKKKKLGSTFKKYSGVSSPAVAAPERFIVVQGALLAAIRDDLVTLQKVCS